MSRLQSEASTDTLSFRHHDTLQSPNRSDVLSTSDPMASSPLHIESLTSQEILERLFLEIRQGRAETVLQRIKDGASISEAAVLLVQSPIKESSNDITTTASKDKSPGLVQKQVAVAQVGCDTPTAGRKRPRYGDLRAATAPSSTGKSKSASSVPSIPHGATMPTLLSGLSFPGWSYSTFPRHTEES